MTETHIPAEIFHASEFVADACIARGWSLWEFAERIGALDTALTVLSWELYAACGPDDPHLHMDADGPIDLERVLGVSADFWRRTVELHQTHPGRCAPLSAEARAWYGLDDEIASPTGEQTNG